MFSGQSRKDANDSSLNWGGTAYGWTDDDYFKYKSLTMEKNTPSWFNTNITEAIMTHRKTIFLETFVCSRVNYDIITGSKKLTVNEYVLAYFTHFTIFRSYDSASHKSGKR